MLKKQNPNGGGKILIISELIFKKEIFKKIMLKLDYKVTVGCSKNNI